MLKPPTKIANFTGILAAIFASVLVISTPAHARFIDYFKDEAGETKWQYVANFSSSVLILALSAALISLFFSHRKQVRANRALEEIRGKLEIKVLERTKTLDESNRLLRDANTALEGEIEQHKRTSSLLKDSEAYIKNILQSMPSMLVGLDESMNITQWNKCAEEVTGISYGDARGKNLWQVYPTITLSPEQVKEVLASGSPSMIKHSQRGQYYFDIRVFPLMDQIQCGVVILIENVTQRILAENMLVQRDKMSSMGELASTMAQDIKIPITAITEDIDSIQTIFSDSEEKLDIKKIESLLNDAAEHGQQVSKVLRNLLEFAGCQGDQKRNAQITDIIDHAVELAESTLSDTKGLRFLDVKVVRNYESALPQIPCYVAELQQVFISLFRHCLRSLALKISEIPDFSPTITLEVIECYDALWIKVQHNGHGLTAEEQHDIFEPFFNNATDGRKNIEAENRLSFTHFILTEHHLGQVAITSDIDVGTTFHIQLQLH